MTDLVRKVTFGRHKTKTKIPRFTPGDTVGVHIRVKEGEKERIQLFKGVVIKTQGSGMGQTFTVRKIASGVGVEKTFPYASPYIEKIDLVSRGKVRRARLFYLRKLRGRAARLDSELVFNQDEMKMPKSEAQKKEAAQKEKEAELAAKEAEAEAAAEAQQAEAAQEKPAEKQQKKQEKTEDKKES